MVRFSMRWLCVPFFLMVLLVLNGCAMSKEDREFYGRGWINPRDLDNPLPRSKSYHQPEGTALEDERAAGDIAPRWATPPPPRE